MNDSLNFFEKIEPFERFSEAADSAHYRQLPEDWMVVITDVVGSTKAIANNKYKEVNLVGAASIIAVLNSLGGRKTPYVFGGDGAEILIHANDFPKVRLTLLAMQKMAKEMFSFDVRVGAVSVSELLKFGTRVEVAKFRISATATIAMIRGGGINLAERLIKSDPRYLIRGTVGETGVAAYDGLSCRWSSIPSKNGVMVSILVLARGDLDETSTVYRKVIDGIEKILDGSSDSRPVTYGGLGSRKMSIKGIRDEVRLRCFGKSFLKKALTAARIVLSSLFVNGSIYFKIKPLLFDPEKYVRDLVLGADFRKFDDMLRMVRDCSEEQLEKMTNFLEHLRVEGRIYYGMHQSKRALMTCLVLSLSDHVHFVDGDEGGYAVAAQQLKEQMTSIKIP